MNIRLPISIRFILSIYITGLLFFTIFRVALISGYILLLPSVVLIALDIFKLLSRKMLVYTLVFIALLYVVAFFGCAADIPFFNTYNTRLNFTILNWTASPMFMIKLILQEPTYLFFLCLFFALAALFIFMLVRIYPRFRMSLEHKTTAPSAAITICAGIIFLGLEFLGIRGRIEKKSPIVVGTAYFSKYDFANQAGLNPIFTFMQSWMDSQKEESRKLSLMDDKKAIRLAQSYLDIDTAQANAVYPFARIVHGDSSIPRYNVIIVMMEGMSASFMRRYGNDLGLTPNLDSLALHGVAFDNFYSAGIHTFNGIYSTMYSFPGLLARHTMEGATIPAYTGMPYTASKAGYKTLYFTTHDDQFDNVGGFVTENHIDTIICKKDYPSDQVLSALGVPDHFMFDFSIPVLNDAYSSGKNFCAFMMTSSNHTPYTIPAGIPFRPAHTEVRAGCVEYADWSIGHFMKAASAQKWFSNTIFVFVADHGAKEGMKYDGMYIGYSHIPFIIYAPSLIRQPEVRKSPGGQIDIYPTLAGLMGLSYTNNTMGKDLWHGSRPFMCFSQDDKVAVADTQQLFIWYQSGREVMFRLGNNKDQVPLKNNNTADSMRSFALSMLQATQWAIDNHKTGPVK